MEDPLQYEGKRVVVTGAASGMGAATAQLLVDLGAEVTALDFKPVAVDAAVVHVVDLRDCASIDAAVSNIEGPVDSVFSCAGLPGPPFPEIDTMLVNFVGARHLIESLVPQIVAGGSVGCISSSVAVGWTDHLETATEFLGCDTFDSQRAWLEANEDRWAWSGYLFSKIITDTWVGWRGAELLADEQIRLNCINPGPTDSPMMPAFHDLAGKELVDTAIGPIGRYATPAEQAWPLVMLNSARMSYVSGEVFWTDGGFHGAVATGRRSTFGV